MMRFVRQHAPAAALSVIALLLALLGKRATLALRYQRDAIFAGEWWRIVTGNLVHLGWSHLAMNIAGLALIWALFRARLSMAAWWTVTAAGALAVGLGLLWFMPGLNWYVGLSGVLHALFAAGALASLRDGDKWDWLLLGAFVAKVGWEQIFGALPGSAETAGGPVIVDAHFYGTIAGAIAVVPWCLRPQKKPRGSTELPRV